jgi:predicted RNase H-like HicB family nuclease
MRFLDQEDPIRQLEFQITILVEPDEDAFHAYCPELKGLHVRGDTEEEAAKNAAEAAVAYIQSLIKHGDPIPVGVKVPPRRVMLPCFPAPHTSERVELISLALP